MAHSNNYISAVKLPGSETLYQIHDENAIHDPSDLGIHGALIFKGVLSAESALPTAAATNVGHVYLIGSLEYVCVEVTGTTTTYKWEKLGNIHDAASSTHTHDVSVVGSNKASTVTGKVTVPTVSRTVEAVGGTAAAQTITLTKDNTLGEATTFSTSISGAPGSTKKGVSISSVAVASNGTASAITAITPSTSDFVTGVTTETESVIKSVSAPTGSAVTGLGTPTTAAAITSLNTTTVKNPSVTAVSIPNVTGNTSVTASKVTTTAGTKASWGASVSNGVLTFSWTANTPTSVSASDVTATNTTLGTALAASKVTTSDVTVATGSAKSTANAITAITPTTSNFVTSVSTTPVDVIDTVTPATSAAVTGLGTPTTKTVLTGVKVSAQPALSLGNSGTGAFDVVTDVSKGSLAASTSAGTNDVVAAVTGASASASTVTLAKNVVTAVTIGTEDKSIQNGSAAAQVWSQSSGSTGAPKN